MSASLQDRVRQATANLRAFAEMRATVLSACGCHPTIRDGQADAVAEFAEAVAALLAARDAPGGSDGR